MLAGIRVQVNQEPEEVEDEEYRVDSGRTCNSHREQECGFGLKITHPEVGKVRDLPFAVNQPMEGLVLIKNPNGFIAFNRLERKNITIKAGKNNEIILQADDHVIFKNVRHSSFKDWAVEEKDNWKSLEASLKELFAKSTQLPPSDGYQLRVNLQPDVHSIRLRLGSDIQQRPQLSFDVSCFKLPQNQTWYFDLKLITVAPNVLVMKEPRRTLVLNQTKNDIQVEKGGTFYFINAKGTGMFESLNPKNASGYVIHASGKKIPISSAIKSLNRGAIKSPAVKPPMAQTSNTGGTNSTSAESFSPSAHSSPVSEAASSEDYHQRY